MRHKTFQLTKAEADEKGHFTALASVFGNVDVQGDRMMKGAFRKTLDKWRESGNPIPIILSHQWDDPFALIGKADPRAVMETDEGLMVQGKLDLKNKVAEQVRSLMSDRLLTGMSFGYTVPKDGEKLAEDGANEVYEVDLIEVGPTLRGANPEAQLQSIKSALAEVARPEAPPSEVPPADPQPIPDPLPEQPDPDVEDADEEPSGQVKAQDPLELQIELAWIDAMAGTRRNDDQ